MASFYPVVAPENQLFNYLFSFWCVTVKQEFRNLLVMRACRKKMLPSCHRFFFSAFWEASVICFKKESLLLTPSPFPFEGTSDVWCSGRSGLLSVGRQGRQPVSHETFMSDFRGLDFREIDASIQRGRTVTIAFAWVVQIVCYIFRKPLPRVGVSGRYIW